MISSVDFSMQPKKILDREKKKKYICTIVCAFSPAF